MKMPLFLGASYPSRFWQALRPPGQSITRQPLWEVHFRHRSRPGAGSFPFDWAMDSDPTFGRYCLTPCLEDELAEAGECAQARLL